MALGITLALSWRLRIGIDIGVESDLIQPNGGGNCARPRPLSARPNLKCPHETHNEVFMFIPISLGTVLVIVLIVFLFR